jgi:hypothetical protein
MSETSVNLCDITLIKSQATVIFCPVGVPELNTISYALGLKVHRFEIIRLMTLYYIYTVNSAHFKTRYDGNRNGFSNVYECNYPISANSVLLFRLLIALQYSAQIAGV